MKKFVLKTVSAVLILLSIGSVTVLGKVFLATRTARGPQISSEELTDIGSPYKIYFERLSNNEKLAYNMILSEIYSMPERIEINAVTENELERVFEAVFNDNPDLFFVDRKFTLIKTGNVFVSLFQKTKTYFSVDYIMGKAEYEKLKDELDSKCESILEGALSDDPWQTELNIHDAVTRNCEYDMREDDRFYSTSYGALVNGVAACEGYSRAVKLLLDEAGIKSALVSGTAIDDSGKTEPHMWNAVELGSEWYYLDATWNDTADYNESAGADCYYYFNTNEEILSRTHTNESLELDCSSLDYYYPVKTGSYFEEFNEDAVERITELVALKAEQGQNICLQFADKETYQAAFDSIVNNNGYLDIFGQAKRRTSAEFRVDATEGSYIEDWFIIILKPIYQ